MWVKGKDVTEERLISLGHTLPSPLLTAVCSWIRTSTFKGIFFAHNSSYSLERTRFKQSPVMTFPRGDSQKAAGGSLHVPFLVHFQSAVEL